MTYTTRSLELRVRSVNPVSVDDGQQSWFNSFISLPGLTLHSTTNKCYSKGSNSSRSTFSMDSMWKHMHPERVLIVLHRFSRRAEDKT